ncbi:MAG TPA: hypothetical protein PKZ00_01450 [Elusimicrobiota bacterium]|nr:hypothetical protein [Elusimicrobiota bacterium]
MQKARAEHQHVGCQHFLPGSHVGDGCVLGRFKKRPGRSHQRRDHDDRPHRRADVRQQIAKRQQRPQQISHNQNAFAIATIHGYTGKRRNQEKWQRTSYQQRRCHHG